MKMTQREATYNAIMSAIKESGTVVGDNASVASVVTKEIRAAVTNMLVEGFKNGSISLDKKVNSDAELRTYCSGLTSNWLRKDPRLNGGVKYSAKNPGSRAGSGDDQVKALRALIANTSDPSTKEEIQGYLDARLAEIKTVKAKKVNVNFDALPAELRERFAQNSEE